MATGSINTSSIDVEEREYKARYAGHILYNSISPSSTPRNGSTSAYSSISLPEDRLVCCGIMSPVRRTFCLILLFDFILTFLLWVIYTQVAGDPIYKSFNDEIVHYTFKESLFDTVLCSAWRFVPLLLAYALFRIKQPWAVAISTCGTCIFLLTKVFIFDFTHVHNNLMAYMLLIVSFILAWVETWFLDFKVLPREQKARDRAEGRLYGERAPLLDGAASHYNYNPGDQYYSPVESDDEEQRIHDEFRSLPGTRTHSRQPSRSSGSLNLSLGNQEQEWQSRAAELWDEGWDMAQAEDTWKLEAGKGLVDGVVHTRNFPGMGKVYRLQGYVDCNTRVLFQELVLRVTDSPKWNPTIAECKTLQIIDDTTDIMYNVAAESAGGVVSSRDFVNLRHWGKREGVWISVGCSTTHPTMPEDSKKHVRGTNGPSIWLFKKVDNNPNRSLFISFINTDLKGWLPQMVVDQALAGVLLEYMKHIRVHMTNIISRNNTI
jgi:hypothetical protein